MTMLAGSGQHAGNSTRLDLVSFGRKELEGKERPLSVVRPDLLSYIHD